MDLKTINKKLDLILKAQSWEPAPMTIDETCAYMKISKSTLYKIISNREIPYFKPNNQKIYFHPKDVQDYVYSHKIETLENLQDKL